MKRFFALTIVFSLFAANSFAAQTSTFGSLWTKLKASPASSFYSLVADSARDADGQVRAVDFFHYLGTSWRFDKNNDIRVMPVWSTNYRPTQYFGGATPNTKTNYEEVEFRYRRSNLLTEDEHGVSLQWQIRYQYLNAKDVNDARISNRLYFNKRLTDTVGLLNYLRSDTYQHNSNKVLGNDTSDRTQRFRYYFWPSYSFNDSFSAAFWLKYEYAWYESQSTLAKTSEVEIGPHVSWSIDAYNSLAFYVIGDLARNDDDSALVRPMNQIKEGIIYELEYALTMF